MATPLTHPPAAFVLIPFTEEFDAIYEQLILPALEGCGYRVLRADSELNQRNILQDVIRGITGADLIVADISGVNPNVMYELGIAHGVGIPTVMITQSLEEAPFDLRSYRLEQYSIRFDEAASIGERLREIGERHKDGKIVFGSPVSDFYRREPPPSLDSMGHAGPREGHQAGSTKAEKNGQDDEDATGEPAEQDEKGYFDFLAMAETAGERVPALLNQMTASTDRFGHRFDQLSAELDAIDSSRPGSAVRGHKIISGAATAMSEFAAELGRDARELDGVADDLGEGLEGYLTFATKLDDPEVRTNLTGLKGVLSELEPVTTRGAGQIRGFIEIVGDIEGATSDMKRAGRQLRRSAGEAVGALDKISALCARGVALIEQAV